MVELRDQQILLLFRLPGRGKIANKGGGASPVPSVKTNTHQRQRQYGKTRYRDADRHPPRWYCRTSYYYGRVTDDRCCRHCGKVEAKNREGKEERTLETAE